MSYLLPGVSLSQSSKKYDLPKDKLKNKVVKYLSTENFCINNQLLWLLYIKSG